VVETAGVAVAAALVVLAVAAPAVADNLRGMMELQILAAAVAAAAFFPAYLVVVLMLVVMLGLALSLSDTNINKVCHGLFRST
jgi:hypothetical protein